MILVQARVSTRSWRSCNACLMRIGHAGRQAWGMPSGGRVTAWRSALTLKGSICPVLASGSLPMMAVDIYVQVRALTCRPGHPALAVLSNSRE
jgi:hypothetical protein